jgi:CHAD domain-containing protein/HD superfamily phosphodiesterase
MKSKVTGLRFWMERVLEECDNTAADFSADPVHDLRVALRRCRSMADGMMALDPAPEWKEMKKAGKQLFQRLGDLRDIQIMMEWIDKLEQASHLQAGSTESSSPVSPTKADSAVAGQPTPARALHSILKGRETEQKHEARAALEEFDRKQWRQWSKSLPQRAARIRPGSSVFKHLALERWTDARQMHARAMRNRSGIALHTLRIGIKRFRYIVENFLPVEHKLWSNDLKHMQDLLGEVHDLDVLWATALSCRVFTDQASRDAWHAQILEERTKRIQEYRQSTTGIDSLWTAWRKALPQGKQVREIALRRMQLWAKALDPDFAHSERVARMSLELYDGLSATGLFAAKESASSNNDDLGGDERLSLYAAALLHDVGKSEGNKGHHKESSKLIKKYGIPLGWKAEDMARAAVVARFHSGALPTRSHKVLRDLLPDGQKTIIRLSAILRLANALDCQHDGQVRRLQLENAGSKKRRMNGFLRKPQSLGKNEALVISAEGYRDGTELARAAAAERYLLETVLRRPIMIKPSATAGHRRASRPSGTKASS